MEVLAKGSIYGQSRPSTETLPMYMRVHFEIRVIVVAEQMKINTGLSLRSPGLMDGCHI